jgi:hypothetical protein
MRAMHDAYLFIYTMAACISSMMLATTSPGLSSSQFFRLECLVRLYIGYTIYHLTRQLNHDGILENLAFEHWYMLYFNDIMLWERLEKEGAYTKHFLQTGQRDADDEDGNVVFSFNATNAVLDRYYSLSASSNPGSFFASFDCSDSSVCRADNLSIIDVIRRIADVASEHWYAVDIYQMSKSSRTWDQRQLHKKYHEWLPWKAFTDTDALQQFLQRSSFALLFDIF